MLKIITGSSNETLAMLQNVVSPLISEDINREYIFSFTTVIDNDKSTHVNYQNKVEVEDNYFQIVYTEEQRTSEGIFINAQCEHVSYSLISASLTAGFTATGQFSAVATTLLSSTGFTVGTVEITASETISVNESTNKRQVLMQLAALYDGELEFDKYAINLLTRRGADRGVQFRYRKNLVDVTRIVDNRKKVAGLPTISYKVNAAELEFEQSYIASGNASNERYELGDTIKVIDEDLNIEVSLRIVKESHDTEQRMQGTIEIGNFVDNLTDTLTQIQTTSVAKDNIYNGCSIGPDNGFVAERSDSLVKTFMNATNGIEIDLRGTTTASYTPVFYVQIDTATGTANLYLAGDAILTGKVSIGTGNNIFKADSNGIYLGNATFGNAPFRVTMSGSATANDLTLTGGRFNVGTGTNTLQFNTTDGLFLGNTAAASAPFKVTMSGALTATSAEINGRFTTKSTADVTLMDIYQDTEGGKIQINDNAGNANVRLGVESGTGDNVGGTLVLYNDGTSNPRIEAGILTTEDAGIINFRDTNDSIRISLKAYDSGISSPTIFITNNASAVVTYLTETVGYINNVQIATQTWAAQAGASTSTHVEGNHNHGIPNGTVLQTVTGTITWVESGGFSHSHTQS